jgi:hypothetical protein
MLTASRKPVQCECCQPATGDLPGVVEINGTRYAYRAWTDHTSMSFRHVRLFRNDGFDGKVIDCFLFRDGREDCQCEDFTYRSGPAGQRCKHLSALASLGILGDPPARIVDEPADCGPCPFEAEYA